MLKPGTASLVAIFTTLVLVCATAADRPRGSLAVGPCNRGTQDNPAFTSCLRSELERLAPVVERYVQETKQGLRATAEKASADGASHEAQSYTEAVVQLEVAQALWAQFRDAHCTMVANQVTGSGAAAAPYRCKVLLTYERLREIAESGFVGTPDPASVAQ